MKKASRILYTIGRIIDILGIIGCAIAAGGFFIMGCMAVSGSGAIADIFEEIAYSGGMGGGSDYAYIFSAYTSLICFSAFFGMLFAMVIYIIAKSMINKACRENATMGNHICAAVFGFMTTTVAGVGGILGAINCKLEENRKNQQPKVEPAKAEEPKVVEVESKPVEEKPAEEVKPEEPKAE